jgi:tetratricopeptide (TPR) repeat protein
MGLSGDIVQQLVNLLRPLLQSEGERRGYLILALGTEAVDRLNLMWQQPTNIFITGLVKELVNFGDIKPNLPALCAFLDVIHNNVGLDVQRNIDLLRPQLLKQINSRKGQSGTLENSKKTRSERIVDDLIFRLEQAERAGNFQVMIELGTQILEMNVLHLPTQYKTASAYRFRGISYYDGSNYDKALEDFNRAISLKPDNADSYYQRARAYHQKGDWELVIRDCTQAIKLKREADYYCQRGKAYNKQQNYDEAIADAKRAIEIDRRNGEYHYLQGLSLYNKGLSIRLKEQNQILSFLDKAQQDRYRKLYNEALNFLNQAIKLNQNKVADYYWIRGLCNFEMENYDQSINDFHKAKELDSDQKVYDYIFLIGRSYAGKCDYDLAISYLGLAIGFLNQSQNGNYYYQRSLCFYNRGNSGQHNNSDDKNALADINRAIELDGFNLAYLQLKGMIEARLFSKP